MAIRAPDGAKNGHILPTGQWYAPSAVINDVLIMPEYARACQSMPGYARVYQSRFRRPVYFKSIVMSSYLVGTTGHHCKIVQDAAR